MKTLLALSMLVALTLSTNATLFYNETFSYSAGALTNVSGGLWAPHSGAFANSVMVSSGKISLVQGSGSREDVNRSTGSTMAAGNTWYAGFDVSVSGGNGTVYFAHFLQGTANFGTRVFVTNTPTGLGDFTFGIGSGANPQSVWATGLSYNTTYRLVTSYDYTTGNGYLWVNPTQQSDPSIFTTNFVANAMTAYAFRQSTGNSVEVIDNLRVATTFIEAVPEPSTFALAGLGSLILLAFRRRS